MVDFIKFELQWPKRKGPRPWWAWVLLPPVWLLYLALCLALVPVYVVFLYGPLFLYSMAYFLYQWTNAGHQAALWQRPVNPWVLLGWELARWLPGAGVNLFIGYMRLLGRLFRKEGEGP